MKRKLSIFLTLVFVFTTVLGGLGLNVAEATSADNRIAGENRFETAAKIAEQAFEGKAEAVIIVRGDSKGGAPNVVDGLTASVLAGAKDAPILLTAQDELPAATKAAITGLGAKKAYIIGGNVAVSPAVEAALKALNLEVERISGNSREDTAVAVANAAATGSKTAIIANSRALVDSLVAGPLAFANQYPILLVGKDAVGPATEKAIKDLGIENLIIVGGTGVVSPAVETALKGLVTGTVERLAGNDRVGTSLAVAGKMGGDKVALVNGWSFVDAVAASTLGLPILYVQQGQMHASVEALLASKAEFVAIGGPAAISNAVVAKAADAVKVVPAQLEVVSINAVNAAQLQITFNKAIQASSVIQDGTLRADVLTFTKVSGAGVATIVNGQSLATLSADGRVLTLTVHTGALNNLRYVVTIAGNKIQATTGEFLAAYTSNTLVASDVVAPTVVSVQNLNASTVRVRFSEPLSSAGNWTFRFDNGATAVVTPNTSTINRGFVDLSIHADIVAGRNITASIIGATDYAGHLINPNPTTITFAKGARDGVKPYVAELNVLGLNRFELIFSEEVEGLALGSISVAGTALTTSTAILAQNTTNVNKWTVTLNTPRPAGLARIDLAANAVSDLSGETNNAFSRVVEFRADTTAPKLTGTEVRVVNGVEWLYLTFDEAVVRTTSTALNALTAVQLRNYVTTTGTANLSYLEAVPNTNQHRVRLSQIQFEADTILSGARYTVTLTGAFMDLAGNLLGTTSIQFERGADVDTGRPVVEHIIVVNNNMFTVRFDRALDGPSATNRFNYNVNGLVVESATLRPGNLVEVRLAEGTNTLSGARNVTVSGVRSAAGVEMLTHTEIKTFTENVRPTVVSATLTDVNQITVVFSEAVRNVNNTAGHDFQLLIGGVASGHTLTAEIVNVGSEKTTLVLTITGDAITPANINSGLSIRALSTINIVDANGNAANVSTVTVN